MMENDIRHDLLPLEHIEYMEKVIPNIKFAKYNFDVGKRNR